MSRSPKVPPIGPEPLDLINHARACPLDEVHKQLENLRAHYPDQYVIVADFFLSCKSAYKKDGTKQ